MKKKIILPYIFSKIFGFIIFIIIVFTILNYFLIMPVAETETPIFKELLKNKILTSSLLATIVAIFISLIFLKKISISVDRIIIDIIEEKNRFKAELKESKDKGANLEYMANHDFLTEIPNKKAFLTKLADNIEYSKRYNTKLAIIYMDLDHFKKVNDTYGHSVGDKVLKEVAVRLSSTLRATDYVARIGGDEFAIMFHSIHLNPKITVEKVLACIRKPYFFDDIKIDYISSSLG